MHVQYPFYLFLANFYIMNDLNIVILDLFMGTREIAPTQVLL